MGQERGRRASRVVRLGIAALAVAVASTSCTSSDGGADKSVTTTIAKPQVASGLKVSGAPAAVDVSAAKALDATVGTVSIAGPSGAFDATGKITVAPVTATAVPAKVGEAPTTGEASGIVVDLGELALSEPLTVRFTLPAGAAESAGVAHVADDGTWTSLPASVDGADVVASTDDFSSLVVFSIDVGAVFNAVGSFVAEQFAGRTDPPVCTGGPSWATVTPVPSGAVHSCVRSNADKKTGAVRAELEIKSNRGTYQWVQLPTDVNPDYVWVEGQPDWLRKTIGFVTGTDWTRTVLLEPGGRLTAGYRRPASGQQVTARVYPDEAAIYISLLVELGKFFGIDGALAPLTAAWCLDIVDVDLSASPTTWAKLPTTPGPLLDCFVDKIAQLWRDPRKAVGAAVDSVAPGAPTAELEASATKFFKLGKAAVVVQLSGIAARILTQTLDAALDAFGFDNVGDATLTLDATPAPEMTAEEGHFDLDADPADVVDAFITAYLAADQAILAGLAHDDALSGFTPERLPNAAWMIDDCVESIVDELGGWDCQVWLYEDFPDHVATIGRYVVRVGIGDITLYISDAYPA